MKAKIEQIFTCIAIFLFVFSAQAQENKEKEIRLSVSVTDERGRYAGGLKIENFQLMVDGKAQTINTPIEQDVPATIVFLIDLSGSQKGIVTTLTSEIKSFIKNTNPNNEYVVIAFNKEVQLVLDKTDDLKTLEEALDRTATTTPRGDTAFYDSVYLGIEKANSGKHQKKVLIVCSDGQNNGSQYYKHRDVIKSLKESDVLFYSVNHSKNADYSSMLGIQGQLYLQNFAEMSGGRAFFSMTTNELSEIFKLIALELKSHYQIAFRVAIVDKPENWKALKIKVAPVIDNNKKIKLIARTRQGFYLTPVK